VGSQYYANQQTQAASRKQRQATITGAANNGSGLIRITAANHRFTGFPNKVDISGVVGTTEANAVGWTITVISANTFDLVGSTFSNAYVSGGIAKEQ
jgi:hypothetical protein